MRLPNISATTATMLMAAAITIVTWIVMVTAQAPKNDIDAPKEAATVTQAAHKPPPRTEAKPGESVTYVQMNYGQSGASAPATTPAP